MMFGQMSSSSWMDEVGKGNLTGKQPASPPSFCKLFPSTTPSTTPIAHVTIMPSNIWNATPRGFPTGSQSRSQSFGNGTLQSPQSADATRAAFDSVAASARADTTSHGPPIAVRRMTAPTRAGRPPGGFGSLMSSQAIIDDDLDEIEAREGRIEPIGVPRAFNATAPAFNPLVSPTGTGVSHMRRQSLGVQQAVLTETPTRYSVPVAPRVPVSRSNSSYSQLPVFQQTRYVTPQEHEDYQLARRESTEGQTPRSPVRVLHSPTLSMAINTNTISRYVVVEFKMCRADVYLLPAWTAMTGSSSILNKLVLVDADRGNDLGRVVQICDNAEDAMAWKLQYMKQHYDLLLSLCQTPRPIDWDEELAFTQFFEFNPSHSPLTRACKIGDNRHQLRSVKREADENEIEEYFHKSSYEEKAKKLCCQLIRKHGLNVEIVDAEFQMDMHKLTFYFWSPHYLHFSALVTDLFKIFKNRIWLTALNPASCIPATTPSYNKGIPNWYTMRTPRLGEQDRYGMAGFNLPSMISELQL